MGMKFFSNEWIPRPKKPEWRLAGFLWIFMILVPVCDLKGQAGEDTSYYYQEALTRISQGEFKEALPLLDRALELDPQHGRALLARGGLYLKLGLYKEAEHDFNRARYDEEPEIRAAAHIGLGDIYRELPFRNLQAAAEYRLALRTDPASREALYALAETGFALRETQGYRMAATALARLICLDPDYRDAYRLWRDKIRDQTDNELREVGACLEDFMTRHPEKSLWWLDLARDRYRLGEVENTLAFLRKLETANPDDKISERKLLEACCLLGLGDTLGFENCYTEALRKAEAEGDFTRLLIEAEPVFTPEESAAWSKLESAAERAAFFRRFWLGRDPDPLSFHNERLVTHYLRLIEAENRYRILFPHSRFQTSRDYFRLISPHSFFIDYDPDLFWNRSRELLLDQRGLLFVRHGPPDRVTRQVTWSDPMEIWYYGSVHFLFEKQRGAGDFIYIPSITRGAGDINIAMQTESFIDPLPAYQQSYYAADFLGPDGSVELEFYQSAPVELARSRDSLEAALGIYDSTWAEVAVNRIQARRIGTGRDTLWLAVHRLPIEPGSYFYAARLDIPNRRALVQGKLKLTPYLTRKIELSGVVLGSSVPPGAEKFHQRRGIKLLPRPSLRFSPGETITVYLELYGLKASWEGVRSYREWVTVSLAEEEKKGVVSSFKRLFALGGEKKGKSLTLTFDRTPKEPQGAVAENFTIDTSSLIPGTYRLLIEVRDNSTGYRSQSSLHFEIASAEKKGR